MYNDGSVYIEKPEVRYISEDISADTMRVTWKWHLGDEIPMVHVTQRLLLHSSKTSCRSTEWRIRYPEVAPPDARYELVVDEDPAMSPEQAEVVRQQKAEIFGVWQKEEIFLHRLLGLWPYRWDSIQKAVAMDNGDRWISYENNVYVKDASFSIHILVTTKYMIRDDQYEVKVELGLKDCDNYIELKTIKLPIIHGEYDLAPTMEVSVEPLVEYMKNSPLQRASRNLTKLAKKLCT
jgi:hypothetical protein